jgi:hypothetical protein
MSNTNVDVFKGEIEEMSKLFRNVPGFSSIEVSPFVLVFGLSFSI